MPDGGTTDAIALECYSGGNFMRSQACLSAFSMNWDGGKGKRAGEGRFSPLYGKEMRKRKDTESVPFLRHSFNLYSCAGAEMLSSANGFSSSGYSPMRKDAARP